MATRKSLHVITLPPLSGDPWGFFLGEEISSRVRVTKFEYSQDLPSWYSLFKEIEALVTNSPENFVLAGDSFGACTALKFASQYLSYARDIRLRGIFVSGAFLESPFPDPLRISLQSNLLERFSPSQDSLARLLSYMLYSPKLRYSPTPCDRKEIETYLAKTLDFAGFAARLRLLALLPKGPSALDAVNDFRKLPGRILIPSSDRLVPAANQERIGNLWQNAQIVRIPESSHLQRYTHPEAYFAELREFLQEILVRIGGKRPSGRAA